jgi:hypothetical protein
VLKFLIIKFERLIRSGFRCSYIYVFLKIAGSLLYHWENFSIAFPPSLTGTCDEIDGKTDADVDQKIKDLFILPSFDELDEVAVDETGKPKLLDKGQLDSIRKNGLVDNKQNSRMTVV